MVIGVCHKRCIISSLDSLISVFMTIGSILLAFALLSIVAVFVARPFIVPAVPLPRSRQSQRQALLEQKEALLIAKEQLENE